MKKSIPHAFALFLSALFIFCSACRRDNSGTADANTGIKPVAISNFAFSISNLTVAAGTTVTWTNNDNTAHTVTADDGSFTSANLNHGDTYSHTFPATGVVPYHCKIHTMMMATVTVQ